MGHGGFGSHMGQSIGRTARALFACVAACSLLFFAAGAFAAAPDNDNFATATNLESADSVTLAGQSNVDATGEDGEPYESHALGDGCDSATTPNNACLQSVWYEWTAPAAGTWTVDTCAASNFGGDLSVYDE